MQDKLDRPQGKRIEMAVGLLGCETLSAGRTSAELCEKQRRDRKHGGGLVVNQRSWIQCRVRIRPIPSSSLRGFGFLHNKLSERVPPFLDLCAYYTAFPVH
jgi:hypothetical protein